MSTVLTNRNQSALCISLILAFVASCATAPDIAWIQVGKTTREEVVERYGEPELVWASPDGDTVTYRPNAIRTGPPSVELPSAQAGPFGTATTKTQPVHPGLGTRPIGSGTDERPPFEFRIKYDRLGIVQQLIR